MAVRKPKRTSPINRGRPPLATPRRASFSSKATRTFIRSHHGLQKAYNKALKDNDEATTRDLEAQIATNGGLAKYQLASVQGQSTERGGDSSRVLVEWLQPEFEKAKHFSNRLRLLEIGALSTANACSAATCLDVRRIDLRSREPGIEEVDFMDMAVPGEGDRFQIISLSLVLNYITDPGARGAMLARIPDFLTGSAGSVGQDSITPCLFLVLPLACVANSRYLTHDRLANVMHSLGFQLTRLKTSLKLYYSLWKLDALKRSCGPLDFRKEQLHNGKSKNNFAIILKREPGCPRSSQGIQQT